MGKELIKTTIPLFIFQFFFLLFWFARIELNTCHSESALISGIIHYIKLLFNYVSLGRLQVYQAI